MAKDGNGNVKSRWLLGVATGLVGTIGIGAIGWYVGFDNNRAIAQGATLTEHAVEIATAEVRQKSLRTDVAEVKAHLTRQDLKLDSQAGTLKDILAEVRK